MADCCLIKKVATVEVYENKNEVRAYGFMAGDRNTPVMEVRFKHLWGESNLSSCKLRWIIVDDVGSLLVGEVPIQSDNTALINLPNELFTGDRRMKVQLTVASCDGERILNLQQFTDLKVINSLAPNEVVEPVYQILINAIYDESQKYLKELETSYTQKYGSLDGLYKSARASLEQYLITAENGGNAEFLQGYSPAHFQKVENTINDLIASTKYSIGDVVEVLGYYSAGDGAEHPRKKIQPNTGSPATIVATDGSHWDIVHNGTINLLWLGVKQNATEENTDFFELASNIQNVEIEIPKGSYKLTKDIIGNFKSFSEVIFNNNFKAFSPLRTNVINRIKVGSNSRDISENSIRDSVVVAQDVIGKTDCHAFADYSILKDVTDYGGYGVFDATTSILGSHIHNHIFSFQDRTSYYGNGVLEFQSGLYSRPAFQGGNVQLRRGVDIRESVKSVDCTLDAQQGVYVEDLKNGTSNVAIMIMQTTGYSFYGAGGAPFYNKGAVRGDGGLACLSNDSNVTPVTFKSFNGETGVLTTDTRGAFLNVVGDKEVGLASQGAIKVKVKVSSLENAFTPETNGVQPLGDMSNRWKAVYSVEGAIQTSDAREKEQARALTEKERLVALELKSKLKAYKWKDAVSKKGEGARWHFGIYAQEIKETFEKHGLVAEEYGMFCKDFFEIDGVKKDMMGVRYEELLCFVLASI